MDLYVVAGRKGDLQAIAVTTSRDSAHPLPDALALVAATLNDADAVARHEAVWQDFWSKSGVELGDKELQNWWYRMLYFNRTFARANGNAVGLAACFPGLAGWHNSLKLNYNIQQTYLGAAPLNHPGDGGAVHRCAQPQPAARGVVCQDELRRRGRRVLPQRHLALRARPSPVQDTVQASAGLHALRLFVGHGRTNGRCTLGLL